MTYIDYIILGVLAFFLIKGVRLGLIRQLTAIAGLACGLLLAWKFYPALSKYVASVGIHSTVSAVISFAVIYIVVAMVARALGGALNKAAKKLFLGGVNRILGGIFGLLEGALVVLLILVLVSFTPIESKLRSMASSAPVLQQMKRIAEPFSAKCRDLPIDIEEKVEELKESI